MLYALTRLLCVLFFKILFRFEVKGRENIPKTGGCIVAINHLSFLDPPALAAASHRVLHFMAREGLFALPILGKFLPRVNVFPVKRAGLGIEAIKEALRLLTRGEIIVIFPEGRRKFNGVLGPAESGIGFLAFKSKASIIPAYIKGSDLALPVHAKFIRLKKINLYFGLPLTLDFVIKRISQVYPSGLDEMLDSGAKRKEVYQEIADAVMERIAQLKENS